MTPHPDRDDERGPSRDELVWRHGKLVERDLPEYQEEKRQRSARRCQIDYPDDVEEYEYED